MDGAVGLSTGDLGGAELEKPPPPPYACAQGQPICFASQLAMSDTNPTTITRPRARPQLKVERPRLHKVILVNDDYTPREFVVAVLKGVFRTSEDQAYRIMITAHRKGTCVVAVFTRDVAETKATEGTDRGKQAGFPLQFTTEPEE